MHILLALSLLPTIIAAIRHSRHTFAIFLLNLFLGWTVIGWVIALVWAITSERKYPYYYAPPYPRYYR